MDVFSRKIVGWQIYDAESTDLAGEVMRDICAREAIKPARVVLHSDNGSPDERRDYAGDLASAGRGSLVQSSGSQQR